jgi:hypothetical protein
MRKSPLRPSRAASSSTQRRRPRAAPPRPGPPVMDIERINAIGNHIADLSERTNALRGYL